VGIVVLFQGAAPYTTYYMVLFNGITCDSMKDLGPISTDGQGVGYGAYTAATHGVGSFFVTGYDESDDAYNDSLILNLS
jgi:hypothetical protein